MVLPEFWCRETETFPPSWSSICPGRDSSTEGGLESSRHQRVRKSTEKEHGECRQETNNNFLHLSVWNSSSPAPWNVEPNSIGYLKFGFHFCIVATGSIIDRCEALRLQAQICAWGLFQVQQCFESIWFRLSRAERDPQE